ncbi:MAG: hypothetical protein BWK80_15795 [Desulfobacteraceae bacterium IS3]|nr:MAG: hypothetical protein BWK80_15795 [Desulfobacteraceae bacterium IS3]
MPHVINLSQRRKDRKVKRFFKSLLKRIKNSLYKTEAGFAPLRETFFLVPKPQLGNEKVFVRHSCSFVAKNP